MVDLFDRLGQEPNTEVALRLDADRYWELVLAALDSLGAE